MNIRFRTSLFMNEAGAEGSTGSAPAVAAPAPAPAAAPAAPAASESLLQPPPAAGAPAAPAPAGDGPAWLAKVPEKSRVLGADGKPDAEATLAKLGESYTNLEKAKTLAPAAPSDYTFTPPEQFKDMKFDDALSQGFRDKAHKAGLSQAQYEMVMGEYLNTVPAVLDAAAKLSAADARQELQKVWQSPQVFEAQINNAQEAINAAPEGIRNSLWEKFGRDPDFLQFAAHVGKDMREDRAPVNADGGTGGAQTLEQMMAHPAYRDPKHPEHASLSAKVNAAAERLHGA